ncbi:MAG: hypothetical protein JJU45_10020 [Acidimicrobiia bacterium]|nr:hypothetical protein [Acidimicrobiia bacterium]
MPWCNSCDRFYNPNSMAPDGSCPTCGRVIAEPPDADLKVPWHFWVLVTATGAYLLWRVIQGFAWLVG